MLINLNLESDSDLLRELTTLIWDYCKLRIWLLQLLIKKLESDRFLLDTKVNQIIVQASKDSDDSKISFTKFRRLINSEELKLILDKFGAEQTYLAKSVRVPGFVVKSLDEDTLNELQSQLKQISQTVGGLKLSIPKSAVDFVSRAQIIETGLNS